MTTEDQPAICRSVQSLLELGHALDRVIEDKLLTGTPRLQYKYGLYSLPRWYHPIQTSKHTNQHGTAE